MTRSPRGGADRVRAERHALRPLPLLLAIVMLVAPLIAMISPGDVVNAAPSKPVVVALCRGANQSWPANFDQAYFTRMWTDTGGSETVADYWRDVSQGAFEIGGSLVLDVQLSVARDAIGDRDDNDYGQCRAGAIAVLSDRGLDIDDYLGVVVIKPQTEGRTTTVIDDDDTEVTVDAFGPSVAADWPAPPFTLVLTKSGSLWQNAATDVENVLVTAVAMNPIDGTTTFTIVRGQQGYRGNNPPAKAWPSGSIVKDISDIYGSTGRMVVPAQTDPIIVTHEFGHFLGFAHSRKLATAGQSYGDCFDIMSAISCPSYSFSVPYDYPGGTIQQLNGPGMTSNLLDLEGWLPASDRAVFTPPAGAACHQQTYSMKGLGLAGPGLQQVRIPVAIPIRTGVTSEYLTVELRSQQFIWDQSIPRDAFVLHVKGDDDLSYWVDDAEVGGGQIRDDRSYTFDGGTDGSDDDRYFHINTIDAERGTGEITIGTCPFANDLVYTGPTSISYGTRPNVTATWSWHAPVAMTRVDVDFELDGPGTPSCGDTISRGELEDGTGEAICRLAAVDVRPGSYDVTVEWDGNDEFAPSSDTVPVTVTRRATDLEIDAPDETAYRDAVTLVATLEQGSHPDDSSPDEISGRAVELSIGSGATRQSCTGMTGITGEVRCVISSVEQSPGAVTVNAAFAGDDYYTASADSDSFVVSRRGSVLDLAIPPDTVYRDPVTLEAELRETPYPGGVAGAALTGRSVELSIGAGPTAQACTAVTDSTGAAECTIVSVEQVPSDTVAVGARFGGDSWYEPTTDADTFVVVKRATSLEMEAPRFASDAGALELSATLVEDGGASVAGRHVVFELGDGDDAQACAAQTDGAGVATCTIDPIDQPLGTQPLTGSFTGDPYYLPSGDASELLVFAWTEGGHFVVGDDSAVPGVSVTYWDSRWRRANAVSGGVSPAAFKGFANEPSGPAECATDWTTRAGGSAGAPNAVPEYTAVLVTDSVAKHGPRISGTTVAIAIVRTDTGFESNPGHPGTATVIGFLCGG